MADRGLNDAVPEILGQTPWQTVGPFFHYGLTWHGGADLVGNSEMGGRPELFAPEHDRLPRPRIRAFVESAAIELGGMVLDGDGCPVPDAMIETWQADAAGSHAGGDGFVGFGRAATGEDGSWRIRTIRPGPTFAPGRRLQAPHLAIGVFGRGLLNRLVTRAYFAGAPENEADPILALVPADRRGTLMAHDQDGFWRFDIVLQGPRETVFLEV